MIDENSDSSAEMAQIGAERDLVDLSGLYIIHSKSPRFDAKYSHPFSYYAPRKYRSFSISWSIFSLIGFLVTFGAEQYLIGRFRNSDTPCRNELRQYEGWMGWTAEREGMNDENWRNLKAAAETMKNWQSGVGMDPVGFVEELSSDDGSLCEWIYGMAMNNSWNGVLTICDGHLSSTLSMINVASRMRIAVDFCAEPLRKSVAQFAVHHFHAVAAIEGYPTQTTLSFPKQFVKYLSAMIIHSFLIYLPWFCLYSYVLSHSDGEDVWAVCRQRRYLLPFVLIVIPMFLLWLYMSFVSAALPVYALNEGFVNKYAKGFEDYDEANGPFNWCVTPYCEY